MLLLALVACHGGGPADSDVALPSPYISPEGDPATPPLDLARVATGLQAGIDRVAGLDAVPVFTAYDQAMIGQSGSCPAYYSDGGNTYWYDNCTSEVGTYFSGYGYTVVYQDYPDGYNNVWNGLGLYAQATVTDAAGHTFDAGGQAYQLHGIGDGVEYDQIVVQGTFDWDGPGIDGTWMAEGLSPDLYEVKATYPDYGADYLNVDGGLSPLPGDVVAIAFDNIEIADPLIGASCSKEPSGSISVRAADGGWIDILYAGSMQERVPPDECDGCGAAFYQGTPLGEVCADFSGLLPPEEGL
jgi:hypothetical protein